MKIHRNAKTTPVQRQLLVARITQQGWTYRQAATGAGVSVRTVAKWLARHRRGDVALLDGSSRPHRLPRQTPAHHVWAIRALRQTRATSWQISEQLHMPRSTVTRVLARLGLNRLALLEPRPLVQRYEWPHAGDLLHLDIKPLGRIRAVGHRFRGRAVHPHTRGGGWEYAHVAVDDATRLAYVEIQRSQRQHTCATFLHRAVQWFARRGIRIRRLLTDNGNGYRSGCFAHACRRWQLQHRFTRPYTPRTNGKAERFIQTLLREWAYRRPYANSATRTAALSRFVRFYNHQRPHASLRRRTPWARFQEAA
jgi:transposase InsO family protein